MHYNPAESILNEIDKRGMNCGVMAAGLCEVIKRSPRGDGTVTRNGESCVTMN